MRMRKTWYVPSLYVWPLFFSQIYFAKHGISLASRAASKGNLECLALLIHHGADVNNGGRVGCLHFISAPIHGAAKSGSMDCLRLLLKNRAHIVHSFFVPLVCGL